MASLKEMLLAFLGCDDYPSLAHLFGRFKPQPGHLWWSLGWHVGPDLITLGQRLEDALSSALSLAEALNSLLISG